MKMFTVGTYIFLFHKLIPVKLFWFQVKRKFMMRNKHEKAHYFITQIWYLTVFNINLWTIYTKILYSHLDIKSLFENGHQLRKLKKKTRIPEFNSHNTVPSSLNPLNVSILELKQSFWHGRFYDDLVFWIASYFLCEVNIQSLLYFIDKIFPTGCQCCFMHHIFEYFGQLIHSICDKLALSRVTFL